MFESKVLYYCNARKDRKYVRGFGRKSWEEDREYGLTEHPWISYENVTSRTNDSDPRGGWKRIFTGVRRRHWWVQGLTRAARS
jgi:hypothetical protein